MSKRIFIDGNINSELCIIATDGQDINYFDYSDELISSKKNNIYLGTVSRVEPSLQAAFIDFGSEKKAFLPFDEIHPSYFKIPHNEKITDNDYSNQDIDDEKKNKKQFLSFYRKYKKLEQEFSVNKNTKITHYKEKLPLFESFGIKNPINSLSEENIYMKSGGYLVINPTEALTSVDINSGRSTSEKNIEITALNTNLEACDEIFKQVQLRNIAGLIVIDFIDMSINGNNLKVERKIKELFYRDRARIQMTKISQFGLMEISRQRIGQSIYEKFYNKCECCEGNGLRKTKTIVFHNIITIIKSLNFIEKKEEFEINIDKKFFLENKEQLIKRVKSLKLKFSIKFIEIEKDLNFKIFEIDQKIYEQINSKSKENIQKYIPQETNTEKTYRRKIKKKIN